MEDSKEQGEKLPKKPERPGLLKLAALSKLLYDAAQFDFDLLVQNAEQIAQLILCLFGGC